MNVSRVVYLAAALLSLAGLAGCQNDNENGGESKTNATPTLTAPPPPASVAPTPTGDLKPDTPAKLSIEARVKTELDGRAEGITGSPLAVTGAQASLQTPTGWATTKSGDMTIAASADKKAQIAAGPVGAEGTAGKLPTAAAALGLGACEWGSPETVAASLPLPTATAADGVCARGTGQVRAAYVALTAEKLFVFGAWDPDGDSANVFGSMRSINKAAGGGDATGIAACCSALRQNAKSAPPDQASAMLIAAGVCDTIRNDPAGRAALAQVRAALAGANVPSTCR